MCKTVVLALRPSPRRSRPPHKTSLSPAPLIATTSPDNGGVRTPTPQPAQREHDWGVVRLPPFLDLGHGHVGMSHMPARAKRDLSHKSPEELKYGIDGSAIRKACSLLDILKHVYNESSMLADVWCLAKFSNRATSAQNWSKLGRNSATRAAIQQRLDNSGARQNRLV